jgi:hypothetical protein
MLQMRIQTLKKSSLPRYLVSWGKYSCSY